MAYSGSGNGTINDPYIILTVDQLDEIRNHAGSYFELGQDIDASDMANWDSGKGWQSIGAGANPILVRLDGKGHIINNFYLNRSQEAGEHGLFGGVASGSYIKNIKFTNYYASGGVIGGVAAGVFGGEFENIHFEGEVYNRDDDSGGIFGYAESLEITNCSSNIEIVSGSDSIGGLIGSGWNVKIKGCKASGYIEGKDRVAGIIGESYGQCQIEDCYNEAEIDYSWFGAGILAIGYSSDSIKRCYNAGYVPPVAGGSDAIMSFSTYGAPTTANNYYDSQTSGSSSSLGTSRTTAQMKTKSTFQNWNIVDLKDFVNEIWFIDEGLDYPRLGWEFEGEDEEPERNISVSLVNKKQSLSAIAKVLNKAVASLTNKKQTLSATVAHEAEARQVSASLANKKQIATGSINALVNTSAVLKNKKQKLTATSKSVISASAILKNSRQKIEATVTKEDVRNVAVTLKNRSQVITSSVSVIIKIVTTLKNRAQKLSASLKALNKAQAALKNRPQKAKVFISLDEMARVASVVLKNKPQRVAATLTNEVKLIVGLTNEKQKIKACVIDMSDRSVQVGLANNPQYCKIVVRGQRMEADYEIIIDRNELFLHVEKNHREIFIVKQI